MTIPVRRGSLTIASCDAELGALAMRIKRGAYGEEKERIFLDADRWLDIRIELAEERRRIKGKANK
jgi:hypothetical protein